MKHPMDAGRSGRKRDLQSLMLILKLTSSDIQIGIISGIRSVVQEILQETEVDSWPTGGSHTGA